jgi:hypothetical protein
MHRHNLADEEKHLNLEAMLNEDKLLRIWCCSNPKPKVHSTTGA